MNCTGHAYTYTQLEAAKKLRLRSRANASWQTAHTAKNRHYDSSQPKACDDAGKQAHKAYSAAMANGRTTMKQPKA